jgi:hypothetical protein
MKRTLAVVVNGVLVKHTTKVFYKGYHQLHGAIGSVKKHGRVIARYGRPILVGSNDRNWDHFLFQ